MNRPFVVLLIGLVLLGCRDQGVEPEPAPISPTDVVVGVVPGVVGVFFAEGTTQQQAEQLVTSLGLSFRFGPDGAPLNGVVSVPTGSEDEWVKRFKTFQIVKSADRLWFTRVS